jgi:hypothetical protein
VSKKLRTEEGLITEYSGARLRMDLDRVPLWRGDHVGLKQLWDDYSRYLYLPRLRNSAVLLDAVRNGVSLLTWNPDTFAYASAVDDSSGRYNGLVGGQHAGVVLDATSVLVKPDTASRQMEVDQAGAAAGLGGADLEGGTTTKAPTPTPGPSGPAESTQPSRFYGRVNLESTRLLRDIAEIADAIVQQLERGDGEVKITVEIEASSVKGFAEDVRRTVTENSRTLKFESHEFEAE